MSDSATASATRPSGGTNQDDSSKWPTHIQWVFPLPTLMSRQTDRHVVGREESCDTVLAGVDISRRHAEFWLDGPVWAVRDLESLNGVFVNGVRRADAPLSRGDVLRCGEWVGVVISDPEAGSFGEVVPGWFGGSTLRGAVEPLRRVGAELPIIVEGETGTGKEGASRIIHSWSRRQGPFVAVNCAALPAQLSEAELFGYRKGERSLAPTTRARVSLGLPTAARSFSTRSSICLPRFSPSSCGSSSSAKRSPARRDEAGSH